MQLWIIFWESWCHSKGAAGHFLLPPPQSKINHSLDNQLKKDDSPTLNRHFVIPNTFNHIVLGFSSSRPSWDPSPADDCVPPLFGSRRVHTRLRERGEGVPIRTRGQTLWYGPLGLYLLCAFNALHLLGINWSVKLKLDITTKVSYRI